MFSERPESLPAFVVFILYILIYGVPRGTLFSVGCAETSWWADRRINPIRLLSVSEKIFPNLPNHFFSSIFICSICSDLEDFCAVRHTLFQSAAPRNPTNLSKSYKSFFHLYLFVQTFLEHRERGICCAPHPRWKDRVNRPTAMSSYASEHQNSPLRRPLRQRGYYLSRVLGP